MVVTSLTRSVPRVQITTPPGDACCSLRIQHSNLASIPVTHSALILAASSTHTASSGDGEVSLIVGAVSLLAAVVAISLAIYQTRQLKQQIAKLVSTENALTETQARIGALSTELYDVLEISNRASGSPVLLAGLRQLAANCGGVFAEDNTYLTSFLQDQLDALVKQSAQALTRQLQVKANTDVAGMALNLVKLAQPKEKVFTTSYVSTKAYWDDPSARRYLDVNRELVRKSDVAITRIFIFDNEEIEAGNCSELDKQWDAGIHVRTALTQALEPDLKRDMFLLGNRLAAENEMTADRNDILSVRIWDSSDTELGEFADRMNALMRSSQEYTPDRPPSDGANPMAPELS